MGFYWYYMVLKKVLIKDKFKANEVYYKMVTSLVLDKPQCGYYTFEYDSKNLLHCNYIFQLKSKINFTDLKFTGCHIHVQKINNKEQMYRTMIYIHKDYRLRIYDFRNQSAV